MKYLLNKTDELKKRLKSFSGLVLLLDYDGTLTEIVKRPKDAKLKKTIHDTLKRLTHKKNIGIGIISGRALDDLKSLVSLDKVFYAGNHGLEIEERGDLFFYPGSKKYVKIFKKLTGLLKEKIKLSGVIVEDKGFSLTFHYRMVQSRLGNKVKNMFYRQVSPFVKKFDLKIRRGKMVLELRPPLDWDKAKAAQFIRRAIIRNIAQKANKILTIYIGDDETDEDAFRELKDDLTVFVGRPKKNSNAKYFLRNPGEVEKFLKFIAVVFNKK